MKKKAVISGICVLLIAILTGVGIYFALSLYSGMGNIVYGMDIPHVIVVVTVYALISNTLVEYMYQVCVLGTPVSEGLAKKKLKTFIIVGILMTMSLTYYIQTLVARVLTSPEHIDGFFRLGLTLVMGLISALSLLVIYLIFFKNIKVPVISRVSEEKIDNNAFIDGLGKRFGRDNKRVTPEQVVFRYLRHDINIISVGFIFWAGIGRDIDYGNSIIGYIIRGEWEKGSNIFAITTCIFVLCISSTISSVIMYISDALMLTFDSRGETIGRMVMSLIKYMMILIAIFLCLSILGFNTGTLVASAGVLSLVVGLGAKELISDIIAGLFIIIEGEFRVGDIITIGNFRGTVTEIGVRTTKLVDGIGNVKIINNSQITDVINMTRNYSFANCDVGIGYDEDLERVEIILDRELPLVADRIKEIKGGPYYRGVSELGESSVVLRISAECIEADRIQLERDLNRELKLIFDRNGIIIPYPQIVINETMKTVPEEGMTTGIQESGTEERE